MNSTVALIAAAVVVIVLIAVLVLRRKKTSEPDSDNPKEEELKGDQELYQLGMNPISRSARLSLTTCQHCKNTRKFLDANNVDYIVIYLDEYAGSQRSDLMEKVRTYNPRGTFPTILVPGGKVIVGFRKQLMQEALIHDSGTTA